MTMPSDPLDPKRLVEQGYDRVAPEYARLEGSAAWPRMRWLGKVLSKLAPRSSVLDLGCGSGDPADVEIAKSHEITGVDISRAQIELARHNVPTGSFLHADAASVDFPDGSFDAVVSFYALEHVPRGEHGALVERIHRWLRPDGYLLLATEAGEYDGIGDWLGVPMYFSSLGPEQLKQMVIQQGFDIEEAAIEAQREGEEEIPYLWLIARKR
jgi:ubiquinone/menaquinone biosynthesis C-methylase UbiE